ncbi:MAG: GNAT family N-acetyltransferase [Acidimicrobiales bacterium]
MAALSARLPLSSRCPLEARRSPACPTVAAISWRAQQNFRDGEAGPEPGGRLGDVRLRVIDSELGVDEGFEELLHLHRARWAERSSFDSPEKIRFHRTVARRLHARQRLYLSVLEVEGKPAAARYDFVYDTKMWCVQGGWNPTYAAARPGLYMTEVAMTWAVGAGLREYDFLGGPGEYKQRWSTGSRELMTVVARNPATVRGRLVPWAERGRTAADRGVAAGRAWANKAAARRAPSGGGQGDA